MVTGPEAPNAQTGVSDIFRSLDAPEADTPPSDCESAMEWCPRRYPNGGIQVRNCVAVHCGEFGGRPGTENPERLVEELKEMLRQMEQY